MDILKPRYVPMNRRRRIYEGKAKILFEGPEPGTLVQFFKDDATAFNKKKMDVIDGKGVTLRSLCHSAAKRCAIVTSTIIASLRAKRWPMQMRGPPPNGM